MKTLLVAGLLLVCSNVGANEGRAASVEVAVSVAEVGAPAGGFQFSATVPATGIPIAVGLPAGHSWACAAVRSPRSSMGSLTCTNDAKTAITTSVSCADKPVATADFQLSAGVTLFVSLVCVERPAKH